MTMPTGRTQYVEQDTTGSISFRLLSDNTQDEIAISATLSASSLTLYSAGGSAIGSAVNPTSVSGAVATYQRTWDAATFPRLRGYKVIWSLSDGTTTYQRTQYIEVVRRLFRSQLDDNALTDRIPYLANRLPAGTADFSTWREAAWLEVSDRLKAVFPDTKRFHEGVLGARRASQLFQYVDSSYPGNVFNPEEFYDAHRYLTLALFYEDMAISGAGESSDERKADRFRTRFDEAFDRAKSRIALDADDDGIMDDNEREFNFGSIELVR